MKKKKTISEKEENTQKREKKFFFPGHGVTISASSQEEALEKLQSQLTENHG